MAPSGRKLNYLVFLVLVVGSLEKPLHGHIQWLYQQIMATLHSNLMTKEQQMSGTMVCSLTMLQLPAQYVAQPICDWLSKKNWVHQILQHSLRTEQNIMVITLITVVRETFDVYWTVHCCDNWGIRTMMDECLGCRLWYSLQPGHSSNLPAPNFQPTANQEPDSSCHNQHYSHELLMMGTVVSETCSAYHKHNKTISSI